MEAHDEGFARNIRKLFGPGQDYEGMSESPLKSVAVSDDKGRVTFEFEDGSKAVFRAEGIDWNGAGCCPLDEIGPESCSLDAALAAIDALIRKGGE